MVPGGVVVQDDDPGGVVEKGPAQDCEVVDGGACERAFGNHLLGDESSTG